MKLNHWDKFVALLILILCYIVFFHDLDEFTIRLWDEGRNAVSALEMLKTKNPIVISKGIAPAHPGRAIPVIE